MNVLAEVHEERVRQDKKWGEQNHPNGTGGRGSNVQAQALRKICDDKFRRGEGAWSDILMEEVGEAFAEDEPDKLRAELVQVAAVAVAWVECIDRKKSAGTSPVATVAEPEEQQRQGDGGDRTAGIDGLSAASAAGSQQDVSGGAR